MLLGAVPSSKTYERMRQHNVRSRLRCGNRGNAYSSDRETEMKDVQDKEHAIGKWSGLVL